MSTTIADLVADATSQIENLDADQVAEELADGALLIDTREAAECDSGLIPGALHVPRGMLEFNADPTHPSHLAGLDPARRTILYCASGGRSALAVRALQQLGYRDVAHLAGGVKAWVASGRATSTSDTQTQ
jgi:rhodanese-related sulfurtransferase